MTAEESIKENRQRGIFNACFGCSTNVGPGTPFPLLRCSKCQAAAFCTRQCQVNNWQDHKYRCKRTVQARDGLEMKALKDNREVSFRDDFNQYSDDIFPEVTMTMRSTFGIGHPHQNNHTHIFLLYFDWDSSESELRDRFHYSHSELLSFDDYLERYPGAWLPSEQELSERRFPLELAEGKAMGSVSLHALDSRTGESIRHPLPHIGIWFSAFPWFQPKPLSETPLNVKWEETFERSVSRIPAHKQADLVVLELLGAVEPEVALTELRRFYKDNGPQKQTMDNLKVLIAERKAARSRANW